MWCDVDWLEESCTRRLSSSRCYAELRSLNRWAVDAFLFDAGSTGGGVAAAHDLRERGALKEINGDHAGAISDCTRILRRFPDDAPALCVRALARAAAGDFIGAVDDFDEAVHRWPHDAVTYCFRGIVKERKGDFEGALKDYNLVLNQNPNDKVALINRCVVKAMTGNHEGAIIDCNRALRLDPRDMFALRIRGGAKVANGDACGAHADYCEALHRDPEYARTWLRSRSAAMANRGFVAAIHDARRKAGGKRRRLRDDEVQILLHNRSVAKHNKMKRARCGATVLDVYLARKSSSTCTASTGADVGASMF